jgi:polyferredoxin
MGIDIRESPFQIECIHCGECVDACRSIMGKFGEETLVHYAWGEKGELLGDKKAAWYRRIGLRDAKRLAVLAIIIIYGSTLAVAFSMRHSVLVRIAANRATMYRIGNDGRVYNTFRMTLANRGKKDASVWLEIKDLPDARLGLPSSEIPLKVGETIEQEFEISVPANTREIQINHFEVVSVVLPDKTTDTFDETFIMPLAQEKK